jgi:hypothetical protein
VKQRTTSRATVGPQKDEYDNTVSDNVGMTNHFYGATKAVFTKASMGDEPGPKVRPRQTELTTVKFSVRKIEEKIAGLRVDATATAEVDS